MDRQPITVEDPWAIDDSDFPSDGTVEAALRFCVGYAILAPSGHNAQPWWFAIKDNTVTIGLDVSRGLAVVDPDDREGIMSIGAALLNLRVALAHFGLTAIVSYWPDPCDPEACAAITAQYGGAVDTALLPLFAHIVHRRTSRDPFEPGQVGREVLAQLVHAAAEEDAAVHVFTSPWDRDRIATFVSRSNDHQRSDPSFRRELRSWLRLDGSSRPDGIHGHTEISPMRDVALAVPAALRTDDTGHRHGVHDQDLVAATPAILVLATARDERNDWLRAGEGLERLLLTATASGLNVGFLDQAVEVSPTRDSLAQMLPDGGVPQLLLRAGYGPPALPQPRRSVDDTIVGSES